MQKLTDHNVVDFVSRLLTEDPNVLDFSAICEAEDAPDGSGKDEQSRSRQYQAKRVPLDRSGTIGSVTYEYEINNGEITDCSPTEIIGYTYNGRRIDPTQEQMDSWVETATDYFHSVLENEILYAEQEPEPSEVVEQPRTVEDLKRTQYRPTIIGARVVKAFKEASPGQKGGSFKVGVRIDLEWKGRDGGWWFVSRKGSWTYHFPIRQALDRYWRPMFDRNGLPVMAKEMKNRWDDIEDLKRDLGQRNPWLVLKLWQAYKNAE
jgi:hypothetical protein